MLKPLRRYFHTNDFVPLTNGFIVGVYVTTIFAGAFAWGVGFDVGISKFWDHWNRGVRPSLFFFSSSMLSIAGVYTEAMEGHP